MDIGWLHFAERASSQGRRWAHEYSRHASKVETSNRALLLLRQGRLEEGFALLEELSAQMKAMSHEQPSIVAVLERWYHGVSGYYFYCKGEFSQARKSMWFAEEAVARAIGEAEWLLMLAVHCQEFCLHQARIAGGQRNWAQMHATVQEAREMTLERIPLCRLRDGREVSFADFRRFFAAIGPLDAEETAVAAKVVNLDYRLRLFDQFVRSMFRKLGGVIDYSQAAISDSARR